MEKFLCFALEKKFKGKTKPGKKENEKGHLPVLPLALHIVCTFTVHMLIHVPNIRDDRKHSNVDLMQMFHKLATT